jgi:hypothetical protein
MTRLDIPVRSPTGTAWILAVMPFIFGGELWWEALKTETATFFRIPFSDVELYAVVAVCGALSLVGIVWVVSLYFSPGRLIIDPDLGVLRRERRERWRRRTIEQPLAKWQVQVQFFSEAYRTKGAFRRLELKGPGIHEVLLLADLPDGKTLYLAFEAIRDRLGGFHIEIKRPSSS